MQPRIPFLDNLPVGTRLFSLIGLALAAIGAAALLFSIADRRLEDAFAEHATALKLQDLTHEITAGITSLHSHQTAFLVGGDAEAAEAYARESARLMAVLETLGKIRQASGVRTHIDTLHDGLAEHATEFRELVDLGLGKTGVAARTARIQAQTEEAAGRLEQEVDEPGLEPLAAAVLSLRGFARRYLTGDGGAFVELNRYRQEVFDARLAEAPLTAEERDEIAALADAYLGALSAHGKWQAEERRIFDRLDEILGYLEPAVEALAGLRREAAAIAAEALLRRESIRTLMLGGAGGVMLVFAVLGGLIVLGVSQPLGDLSRAARQVADGDPDAFVPIRTARDELGDVARGLRAARDSLTEAGLRGQAQESQARSRTLLLQATQRTLVREIETEIGAAVSTVARTAADLSRLSEAVGQTAEEIARRAEEVGAASKQTSGNLRGLAGAAARLHNAVTLAEDGLAAMDPTAGEDTSGPSSLTDVAWELRTFLERVANIALRTRLVALKGAVASVGPDNAGITAEIGELADRVAADGIGFSDRIKAAVTPLSDIAASIEMQGAAVREILRNAEGAVSGTLQTSNAVSRIGRAAEETGRAARELKSVADEAARHAERLRGEVETILTRVRTLTDA